MRLQSSLILLVLAKLYSSRAEGSETIIKKPNIVFILVDDVGWADFGYNSPGFSSIPTPNIDRLAGGGLALKQHYVHPTCTPSRAAFMTGRYSVNTGLMHAMFPGSVAGLPEDMPTLPTLMKKAGYSAHMVGKWHLGHSQRRQTPVGRGFESHVGGYMHGLDSYDKSIWSRPWSMMAKDWVEEFENGAKRHFVEARHATVATTENAVTIMGKHGDEKPLFLYVSFNAAHSPLQAEASWEEDCVNIPHLWRRQYCALVVGLDLAIHRLEEKIKEHLGEDSIMVVSSDNGGSNWFGGINAPLRSGKSTPFEGGVRVPAFAFDFSGGRHLGRGGREIWGMVHICDWLPTFLGLAGRGEMLEGLGLDGLDQGVVLRGEEGGVVRNSLLLDVYTSEDTHDGQWMTAFRKNEYKLIEGSVRDADWYYESRENRVNSTNEGFLRHLLEWEARLTDWIFGESPNDLQRILMVNIFRSRYAAQTGEQCLLFDVRKDPEERHNLAYQLPEVVQDIRNEAKEVFEKRMKSVRYWMVSANFTEGFEMVDCGKEDSCIFTSPWLPDTADLNDEERLGLFDQTILMKNIVRLIKWSVLVASLFMVGIAACVKRRGGRNHKKKTS